MPATLAAAAPVAFAAVLALDALAVAAVWPALRARGRWRTTSLAGAWLVLVLAPLLIPAHAGAERVMAAIIGGVLLLKLYDVAATHAAPATPPARAGLAFMPNFTSTSLRGLAREPRPAASLTRRRLAAALALVAAVVLLLRLARRAPWADLPFALEHAAKAGLLFVGFVVVMDVLTHATRLAGAPARDVNRAPWRARTPAEFWRRYNRTISQFMDDHAFRPARRRGWHPALAVLAASALSGLLHEYIFTMATGRLQGFQTAFFLLNGAAVAATARLRPRGRLALLATAATLTFILATGVLFFLSLDSIVTFYAERP